MGVVRDFSRGLQLIFDLGQAFGGFGLPRGGDFRGSPDDCSCSTLCEHEVPGELHRDVVQDFGPECGLWVEVSYLLIAPVWVHFID